ncbi:MAG TPA: B12-binding domain-containing radical SAM protein, partial [Phycisphaerales bacterium]|nr:B12-binding domain-containing radical SAM protein [Phycisphaerales bacterium]
ADAIEAAWRAGARLDAWDEHFRTERWTGAFEQTGVDAAFFGRREIPESEPLPWAHIVCHRGRDVLLREYHQMRETLAAEG